MNTRIYLLLGGLAVIAGLIWAAVGWERKMVGSLPEKQAYSMRLEAYRAAAADANGNLFYNVLGTGSMFPYMEKGKPTEVVAYAVGVHGAAFADVKSGMLVIRRAVSAKDVSTIHQATEKLGDKWILSGLNNPKYDRVYMDADNFQAIVKKVYVW